MSSQDKNNNNTNTSNKLKTGKVKDEISKGKTVTGSKPDEININPVQEDIDSKFEKNLQELNIQQRMKKALNLRRIQSKVELARKRALLRRGTSRTIAKRARVMAISTLKSKLSGGRSVSDLSAMEKQRVEDILKRRKGVVNRLALRLIPKERKIEAKRFLNKEEVDLGNLNETVDYINQVFEAVINRDDTHLRDQGTNTLVDIYKNDTPGEDREAIMRSGQDRKKEDLVPRSKQDRKKSTAPYRQQEIQKKIVDEDIEFIEDAVDEINEALSWIDKGEYDYEGAMSRTQLQTICRSAQELVDVLRDDDNMPEWVQAKITKAEDYITSVNSYIKSKMDLDRIPNDADMKFENFLDGKNPQDKGDMARHGLKGKSTSQLKKIRSSDSASKREKQLAHWYINMHKEEIHGLEEKSSPTNPELWSRAKSLAKQKFDVYPSAYANGWAAKWYKSKGGGWKSVNESKHYLVNLAGLNLTGHTSQPHFDNAEAAKEYKKKYKHVPAIKTAKIVKGTSDKHGFVTPVQEEYNTPIAGQNFGKTNHYDAIDDLALNTANRNLTIKEYSYGPLNPDDQMGSEKFWQNKAELWQTSIMAAKASRCSNCAAFNQTEEVKNKISNALGPEGVTISEKANLGFCELFEFKCAGDRSCDAWLKGGPITKISEELTHHLNNKIDLSENLFRYGSEKFFDIINEARYLHIQGLVELSSADKHLIETDIGRFGIYEGEEVPLDLPLVEEDEKNPPLNKPKRGGPKKFYVYVRKPDGGIKKVTWGDTTGLSVKMNNPEARKSFAARHQCSMQKDRTSAAYWACNTPRYAKSLGLSGGGSFYW